MIVRGEAARRVNAERAAKAELKRQKALTPEQRRAEQEERRKAYRAMLDEQAAAREQRFPGQVCACGQRPGADCHGAAPIRGMPGYHLFRPAVLLTVAAPVPVTRTCPWCRTHQAAGQRCQHCGAPGC